MSPEYEGLVGGGRRYGEERIMGRLSARGSRLALGPAPVVLALALATYGVAGPRKADASAATRPATAPADAPFFVPRVGGTPWVVARNPDLGDLSTPRQQPVDFGVWQAADGSWQLWSCIRHTKEVGKTRLFYRWEGAKLTDPDWKPMGVAMRADPARGETPGGLQAPHVVRAGDGSYRMYYGDWERICLATSTDGKAFTRHGEPAGSPALFSEADSGNTRDAMVLKVGGRWHCYYTAYPNQQGAVYARTSPDGLRWGESVRVAFGGAAGTGPYAAECPFVVERDGWFYLFRTQRYGADAITRVYRSKDPLMFGVNEDDRYLVAELPIAAPEVIVHEGRWYVAYLLGDLKGIQVAALEWVERADAAPAPAPTSSPSRGG